MRPRRPLSEVSGRWTSPKNQKHAEIHGAAGPRERRTSIGTKQLRSSTGLCRYAYRCRKAFGRHQLVFPLPPRRTAFGFGAAHQGGIGPPKRETTEAGDGVGLSLRSIALV